LEYQRINSAEVDFGQCSDLAGYNEAIISNSFADNGFYSPFPFEAKYRFNVLEQGNYIFKVNIANNRDNFQALTNEQIDYLIGPNFLNTDINTVLDVGDGFVPSDNPNEKYQQIRSFIFSVYVDGTEEANKKGFLLVKNANYPNIQEGSLIIGNLTPGEHNIYLRFLNDFYWDFSALSNLPDYFNEFSNANLGLGSCSGGDNDGADCLINNDCSSNVCQKERILDNNPIIDSVAIDQIVPADDVIGVRIYTNNKNLSPRDWYKQNVINASSSVVDTTVDGYRAIRDDRTVYVHAANLLADPKICRDGANDGLACNFDSDCPDGSCITPKTFYSNIYVLAYNQNAALATENIFNQMLDNWLFNKNIIEENPFNAEEIKDKLRRDTLRKSDATYLNNLLEAYKSAHGQCPSLEAGTFVAGHTISSWPSWQSTLGNQLGAALPDDPLNVMTSQLRGPYDCNNPIESGNCQNVCTRDGNGNALTGCPADQQCVGDQYCSICPPGYDPQTCWDEVNLKFSAPVNKGCSDSLVENSFNLGGTSCNNDGAYVYQYYVDSANKNSCNFLIRYEFEEEDVCSANECVYNGKCYQPGSCLAGCSLDGDGNMVCENENLKNLRCFAGTWQSSCGDNYIQQQCGEMCDGSLAGDESLSWCDIQWGGGEDINWYKEDQINASCSNQCQWQGISDVLGYLPAAYTPDVQDDVDCGGYCGDNFTQPQYEECDLGQQSGTLQYGGFSKSRQYLCSGSAGNVAGEPVVYNGGQCQYFGENIFDPVDTNNLCSLLPSPNGWVFTENDNLVSLGGFKAVYRFNVTNEGIYNLTLSSANQIDNISSLSDQQLAYIIGQKETGDNLYNIREDGGLNIPEYGDTAPDATNKNNLLRSFIYSVYLDGDSGDNLVGYLTMPAANLSKVGNATISLGRISSGNHDVYLHFLSDHFYFPIPADAPDYLNSFSNADIDSDGTLDINPVITQVQIFSPELNVGQCQTYGGWCGDGILQLEFGEKCEIKNYNTPSPRETVNIAKNGSFEKVFSPWQIQGANADLSTNSSYEGMGSLIITSSNSLNYTLSQFTPLIKDQEYNISFKVLPINNTISSVEFEIGDNSGNWQGVRTPIPVSKQISGWNVYEATVGPLTDYGYKFRLYFTSEENTSFYIDDIKLISNNPDVRPQYECGNKLDTGQLCAYKGGYCGDGLVQLGYGETCDDRVGLSCNSDSDCGANGYCGDDKICGSNSCNNECISTYCGDGIVQRPNSLGVNEVCDYADDPLCSTNCRQIKMGGECTNDVSEPCDQNADLNCRVCESGLSCTVRNFGDTNKKCLGARGAYGCKSNSDCILGHYCNISTSRCESEISTYLKYHPEEETRLDLPDSNVAYDVNITKCPNIITITANEDTKYLLDTCSGINWNVLDNISRPNWSYDEAVNDACGGAFRLPTAVELYSLVRQTNTGLLYADKDALNLCPLKCNYDENNFNNFCSEQCGDDNYLYWTDTCVERDPTTGECSKALAVNFKYGSIEEYSTKDDPTTPDYNEDTRLKVRCLKDTVCGNTELEEGETCEFFIAADGSKIEQDITRQCSEFGYDEGYLHCDPLSCTYKFDNCVFNSRVNQTCEEVCQSQKTLSCKSVGLNIDQSDDYYDIIGGELTIADSGKLKDNDQTGNCVDLDVPGNVPADQCDYRFIDRQANCYDTLSGKLAPQRSQYSYCNCDE